jgi:hypothetical protein
VPRLQVRRRGDDAHERVPALLPLPRLRNAPQATSRRLLRLLLTRGYVLPTGSTQWSLCDRMSLTRSGIRRRRVSVSYLSSPRAEVIPRARPAGFEAAASCSGRHRHEHDARRRSTRTGCKPPQVPGGLGANPRCSLGSSHGSVWASIGPRVSRPPPDSSGGETPRSASPSEHPAARSEPPRLPRPAAIRAAPQPRAAKAWRRPSRRPRRGLLAAGSLQRRRRRRHAEAPRPHPCVRRRKPTEYASGRRFGLLGSSRLRRHLEFGGAGSAVDHVHRRVAAGPADGW